MSTTLTITSPAGLDPGVAAERLTVLRTVEIPAINVLGERVNADTQTLAISLSALRREKVWELVDPSTDKPLASTWTEFVKSSFPWAANCYKTTLSLALTYGDTVHLAASKLGMADHDLRLTDKQVRHLTAGGASKREARVDQFVSAYRRSKAATPSERVAKAVAAVPAIVTVTGESKPAESADGADASAGAALDAQGKAIVAALHTLAVASRMAKSERDMFALYAQDHVSEKDITAIACLLGDIEAKRTSLAAAAAGRESAAASDREIAS